MWYALAYFPDLNDEALDHFRQKYDASHSIIKEHMPLLFMIPQSVGLNRLEKHIAQVNKGWQPFRIHFTGLKKTWDHWLLLIAEEGDKEVRKLHNQLYSGILKKYKRDDIPFDPHIGLGLFADTRYDPVNPEKTRLNEELYHRALNEARKLDFDFWCTLDELILVKGEDMNTPVEEMKKFRLK